MPAKTNPKRWYLVMVFCVLLSFFAFVAGPRIGLEPEGIRTAAMLIAIWAPVLGILGLRAELLARKD